MATIKISKKDMVEAITVHLSAQGKRMTNLNKSSEDQLKDLVLKYGIDIQEFAKNRKEEMKVQRAKDKKKKEERKEKEEEASRRWNERRMAIKKLTSVLDLDIFRLRDSIHVQLMDTIRYKNNKAEIDAENTRLKLQADQMFQKFQNELPSGAMLERVDDYTLNVRGVMVNVGSVFDTGVNQHEYYINWSESYCELDLFGNIYDKGNGLLDTIVEQYKLYINGKANWIVEKEKQKKEIDWRRKILVDTWGEHNTIMPNEVFEYITDQLTDKQIEKVNNFIKFCVIR